MKTKIGDKKGKKRSLSETSVSIKSNQKQENTNEFKKGHKKAKFVDMKQNGNPISGEKKSISKVVNEQKKEHKIKLQSNIVKPLKEKKDIKQKTESTIVKSKEETGKRTRSRKRRPYAVVLNSLNLTPEQIKKKIAEITSREIISKRATKILKILNGKLQKCGIKSEKLDTIEKKSNKKAEHHNVLKNKQKANDEGKIKAEKKHFRGKDKPQEDDVEEDDEDDSNIKEESEEEDIAKERKKFMGSLIKEEIESDDESEEEDIVNKERKKILELLNKEEIESDDESDEEEDEEESEEEEEEEEVESEEDEEVESEDEEDEEDQEDEEDEEEDEEDEEDDKEIIQKTVLSQIKKKEIQNKNKQEQNKKKQIPQSIDNQQKGEMKKRYVLFVGNLPLNITEDEIKQHFSTTSKIHTITSIRIPTKPDKTLRGFAYVEVTNEEDYERGLSLNNTFLKNKRINVQYSIPAGAKKANAKKSFQQKAGQLAHGNQNKKPFKKEKKN